MDKKIAGHPRGNSGGTGPREGPRWHHSNEPPVAYRPGLSGPTRRISAGSSSTLPPPPLPSVAPGCGTPFRIDLQVHDLGPVAHTRFIGRARTAVDAVRRPAGHDRSLVGLVRHDRSPAWLTPIEVAGGTLGSGDLRHQRQRAALIVLEEGHPFLGAVGVLVDEMRRTDELDALAGQGRVADRMSSTRK